MMKKSKYCIRNVFLLCVFVLISTVSVMAQSNANNDLISIQLPDMTTSIEGDSILLEEDAIPDFTVLLPNSDSILPVLADGGITANEFIPGMISLTPVEKEKTVFIEGVIGAGFPGSFEGVFSIYSNGENPFELDFAHETVSKYNFNEQTGNFNSTYTNINGTKELNISDTLSLNIGADYTSSIFGLQSQSPLFYNIFAQQASGNFGVNWQFANSWKLLGDISGQYLTQYVGFNGNLVTDQTTSQQEFVVSPKIGVELTLDNFSLGTMLTYDIGMNQNRLDFGVIAEYNFTPMFKAAAEVGIVVLPSSPKFIVPFTIGIQGDSSLPVGFAVEGGLRSTPADLAFLQNEYPYMFSGSYFAEETEWFAEGKVNLPFTNGLSIFAGANYANTAFNGGRLLPSKEPNEFTGLYEPTITSVSIFDTELSASWNFGMFGIGAGWTARWFDNLYGNPKQELQLSLAALPQSVVWGSELTTSFD